MAQIARPTPPNRQPPFAEERADSRIGLSTGMFGAQNVTRLWNVYCTSRTHNPAYILTTLSAKDGGVRIGESYPKGSSWSDGTFVLLFLTIVDHWIGTGVWVVRGFYGPPTVFPSTLWNFNIRGSMQTERVYTTIATQDNPSKGIGPPEYTPKYTGDFSASVPGRPTVKLALSGGSTSPTDPRLPRFIEGADRPVRVSSLNFWKTIPAWRLGAVSSAWNNKNYVNSDDVIVPTTSGTITFASISEGGRGIMMLDEISLEPIQAGIDPSVPVGAGPSFRVGISIKVNPDGWNPVLRHVYKADSGAQAPIYDANGNFIDEEFIINGETSFSALFGSFL